MSTYCRITGKSRGLPKPNYFPLLPPISPADAKRFCRITGKSYGLPAHHYIPVLVGRKKKKSDLKHVEINGYRYVFPIIDGCSELSDVLKTKCTDDRRYVYSVDKRRCSLVFPTSLEKAVRDGDVKDVMMSETSDTVLLKLRKGKTVELEIKEMEISGVTLMEGEGFRNRPKQKKTVKEDWRRKIFEDKEKESDAELEQEELKSKRITFSAGQGKQIESIESIPKIIYAKSLSVSKIKNIIKPTTENIILGENNNNLRLQTDILPTPISIEPNIIDLGSAFPGVVHQTFLNDTFLTNLPIISVVSPIKPLIKNFNKLPVILPDINSCAIEEILTEDNINKLLTIDEIKVLIENIQLGTQKIITTSQGTTKIFKLDIKNCEKYVPGQYIKTEDGEKFVPGKIIDTANGKLFVHGVMVQTSNGPKFLPGQIIEDSGKFMFIVGQNIMTREGESFVPGQTITIEGEKRFVSGQTVITPEGIGFVAGQVVNNGDESDFIPGQTVMTIHGPQFIPGQFWNDENIKFTPGQSVLKNNGDWEFVPGVCVGSSFVPGLTVVENEKEEFIPGRIVETDNDTSFIPGITTLDNNGNTKFVPGISIETENGIKFVSGNILSDNDGNKQFILGHVTNSENGKIIFTEAKSLQEVICSDEVQSGILTNDSFYPKGEKSDEVFGQMVQTAYGVEFYPGDQAILPAGKIVPGKLIRNNGIRFVPGVVVDNKFIPGQIVVTDRGEQFVPGQVIETQMGPKFVPGQVVETETGSKFVPGQTIETKDGIKFVPGQIVETKAGPTFIPGQIIFTEEEGSRFVPGQVVDTIEGPRFVPGRVVETGDCVTFVPGQVVETTEGLKFIAPDLQDADDGVCEFSVQGFEVSPEELQVIQPNFPQTSYYTQNGKMALDSKMLEQLSFAGMSIGRQVPAELPEVDVRTLPSMEVAYDVAEKLEFNNDNTIKLAHIINRLCKLDLKNTYYGSPLVQNLMNKLPKIKTNENVAEVIENLLNTAKSSPITALNEIYVVIFDDGFVTDLKNPNKVNILKGIMNSSELESKYIAEAFSEILNDLEDSKLRSAFEHIAEENIELLKEVKLKIDMKKVNNEKEAIEALQWAIVSVINKNSEITVNQMLKDNKSEQFNRLLSDAVGLAKALGLKEVASVLMDVLDDRRSADILASDKITIEILRRLTVMRKLAERRPEFSETLNGMSIDPIEARLDPKLRELVRESGVLLLPPESNVETSFDVPAELFSPGNSLAMEDFMVKSRKMGILLIIKNGLQAVVPREAARLVLTGQVPYTVLDERGMHRFEPMNVLDVLNIRAFSSGRYSMYNCAVQKTLTEDEGTITRGSSISLDDRQLTIGEGGGDEYEVLQDYETEPVDGADEEDDLILEPGDRVVVLKQSKDDPSMGAEVKRNLLLDNAAAKHKMSVRPNKVHPTKHKPLDTDGSLVQSLDEPTKMGYVPNSILKKIPAPVRATAVVPAEGQTLSKKDAKFNRDVVLAELVETEEEFGQDIQEVVERYLNPLELNDAPRIVRDNKDLIFNNLKQISQFHNTVLIAGLKYAASEPKTMGRTFLRLERDFDKHVNYCQTEPEAQDFLECNYQVRDYFEDERLKVGDDKALSEHLKLPIQRINDYQLLLKELVKYSLLIGEDTTDLERALELMLSIPHRFTDTKFLTNIEGFHGTIHKLGRLLKHGWYYVQDAEDPKGHQRYCFLFKSRILVCKVRRISEDKSVFVLKDIIRLPEVTVKAAPDNKRVWVLHHRLGEVGNYPFTFRANEDLSRDQWITEIEEHRNDLREKEDLQDQFWEREFVSITETSKSSVTVTNVEHNSDDIKVQKQKDEDLFEPLKGIELDISKEIEEGLDPIERRLAPKPLKHVEEPKRPPLTLPPKEPIFECTSPPEPKKRPEPEVKVEEPPVIEMPVPQKEVIVEKEIKEEVPAPQVEPIPTEPPPPERSPSPAEEEIESEPLKYVEGVSKPYFHVNIKGTSRGGVIEECNEWWDTKGEFKSGRSMNNESSLAVGENATFECEIEGATKVTWLKNNMPLPNTIANRTSITEDKENNLYKLQLNKVIISDSGTYTVKAENDLGESTSTALLFVENLSADEKKARAKANAPIFAVKLADTQLLENTHARFMIEIKANPLPKLRFFKGDKEISDENTRIQILEVNKEKGLYEMVLPNVKQEDAGEYRVIASNKYSEESCSCHVSVTNEKDLWAGMQTIVPDGTPHFTWLKNGKPFNPEERFKVLFKDDEDSLALVFQNVKPEDAGLYTCIASTCHGKISCSAELSVQGVVKELNLPYAPRVTTDMKEFETKIQSTAILEAKVIGDPLPDIIWFKNDEEIQENERIKFMFEDEIAAIVIKNVEVEDEGEYKVLAKNDLGSDTETINLLIKAAPKFKKNLIDYEGVTGKEITLTVEIEASPKPIVQWYKDSKVIKKSNRIKYVTDEVAGVYTLIIQDCKMEDVGLYSVVASNQFSQISDACRINLQMPPQFIGALAKEVETLEGDYVSLSVRVEGDPPPQVKWYFEDKLLIADKTHIKINAVEDVHTLLISNLTREDSGKYTCEISNEFGKNTSEGKLLVKCPPIFETPLTDTKAIEGDTNVEFTVKLNSYPKSSVQWFREEEEITETTTEFTCFEDGDNFKLIIKEAKTKLAGTYKCRATNEIGTYDSEATLTVMSQPTFKKGLRDMEVTEGGMLKLQVTCYGSPAPEIKWFKDGKEVRSDAHIKISKDKKRVENFSLTVNLVKVEDGGEYEVRATNEMGTAVTKSIVNILAKHSTDFKEDDNESAKNENEDIEENVDKKEKVPPKIISGMDDDETYESLTKVFNVKARGAPKPKVQWFKDGNELSNTRNIQINDSEEDESFKLTIQDLRVADSGSYCCKLTNEVGEDMKSAKLNVQDVELLRGPKIRKPLSDIEVIKGQKVEWSITLIADPIPEVEWTCDGKNVNADFTVNSSEIANGLKECTFTMTIPTSELSDTGLYRVKATNKFDSAECSAHLDIVMKPEIEGFHDVTVIPSMEAIFEAIIHAVPKPKIVWTINGKDLSEREFVNLTSEELEKDITKFKIVIGDVNPEEEGEYVVKAWNKVGETTAIANLKLHTEEPSFVKLMEDLTIQEYDEVQLSVRVNGIPKPKITWFRNGEVIIPDLRISIHTNEEGQVKSTLTIDHFSGLDIAKFSVKAVNMMGEAETSSNLTMAEIMPSFVKPFERITEGVEGSPIEIQTQLIGSPRPHVAWYKDGEELKNTEGDNKDDEQKHITLEANPNGTVMIKIDKVEQGDCGAYKIIATNNFGTSATNTALVVNELPKKPILIKHPNKVDVNENEILKIEAQYVAYPDAIVKWYKDGHVLHPCPQIDFVMGPNGNVALVIEKATLGDAGDYEIVVSNELGKADGQIKVKVNPAATVPAFIMPLRDSKVVEGFPAKLPFRLSGFPLPEIAWTINDKPLVIDGEKIKMAHEPDGLHYLLIEKAGPEHAGKLAIIASNDNGNTASEAKLSVTSKINTDSLESKPEFLHGLKDTTVEESNALTLLAPFLGNPIPDVKWEKDGKILQPCNKVHFTCDGYKVGLEILDTNTGDAGQYTCTLTNDLGATKSECQVGIRKLYQAPVFTQRFSHNQQLLSRDAKFHARVTGVPSPSIIWHKNGHQLTNGDKYKLKRDGEVCSLTISDVNGDDAGLYSCIATNRDGTATCEAQLSIAPRIVDESRKQEPPSFMKKIGDCEVFDGMTAKFTACATGWPEPEYEWFLDTNRLYETERIRMEKEGSGLLRLKILHADSIIDSGRYKLRIFNPHGEAYCEASILFDNGLDSRSKRPVGELYKDFDRYRATGAPLPLPDPPTITRMSDKRLTLSWKPSLPITPRTPVTYLVEMEEQPKGEWTTVRAGIRGCACDIHNLIPFRDYKFRVRVENNYGISDPSPFVLTYREKLEPDPPKFTPYLPIGTDFKPESSPYFPRDFDIERPPHDNYAQAPRFLHQEHDTQYGVKGHNVNLYWFVYGYPKPKMQYYFDNQLIEMGGRYDSSYTRNGQATLFINKMLDRDIGTYEAVATNEHGTARQRVRLQIAEYPKFLKRPEEMYVILRKNCKLEARVIGVPYPEIKWFKDWKPLVDSARIQIEQVEPDVCILRIEDVIMKDEGLYSISARNLAGSVSTSVAIHVEDRESDYSYNGKTDIKWKKKDFSDLYDIGDELGRGTQGVVYHAVERSTGKNYAAKIMHAKGDNLTKLMDNELKIMTDLSNRRIIRIHDALQTSRTYTLITELAGGGELLDILTKHSFLTEYDIALYIIQLLKALKHMHDFEIAHLGLTPGDLLISHPGGDTLKLCDFGLSRKINRRKLEPVYYGMPEFISPEIAKGEGVDLSSDMWSVGVITHLLLTGMSLFRCVNDADTLDRVKSGSYTLSTKISDLARDFISKLLVINPNDRLDVISALQHPWLQFGEDIPAGTSQINTDSLRNYYNNLKDWYSNASCRNWYRCRTLSSAYTHPSKMIYPPGFTCTPSPTPEPEPKPQKKHLPSWKDKLPSKEPIDTEIGIIKSESHYQYGPDTYLLQLRDTNFPVRLREYMKVAGKSLTHRGGSDSHLDWEAPVIRERRKFTDIMDEEIEDEQKARISKYGADIYTLRRLKQEIGSRPTAHVEAEAILESRIDGQPPFFREKPQKLPVEPDKPADLMCLAVGVPKPLVQWFKNDIVLTESHRIKMLEDNDGRSILRLDPATELDLGIYKVVARNKFGQTTARARLVLAHEPGPMEAPIVKEYSDTEILLRWDHPKHDGNAPILCYQLEVRENESEWELVAKNIDHEFWLMQNLRPYTNYEFRLAAMNHIAWGPTGPSSPIVRTHFPDAQKLEVPPAMLNLQIITESGREIIGDEPRNNLDYSLEYKPIDWAEQPPIEKYRFISEIARGRFSVILKGINTSNDSIVVAKLLEITPDTESRVTHEFNVLKSLKHERIAYLVEAFKLENAPVAVFIQEKLQGADILTYLSTKENYSEQTVATIVTQVLDGLQYLHWRGYAHLDLQPDNIVMASVRTIHIKLIDFGCAQKVSKLGAVVGANSVLEFTAPEILCDEPAYPYSDIWSLGVIAYTLLSGMSPFRGSNDTETRQNITFVRYRFEYLYKDLSQEATRFLMLLFKRTPTKRPSAEECHEHRWLLPTEYMIKKREKTMFNSYKLQHFAKEYHENRTKFATSSQKLLGALGTRQIGLGRSNSVVDELLIFK
ncbi:obscurin-like isoform X5 [Rhopalosiphum maidis]|uniref:obscurin-like isoform X5 n=1 Tax=Rhopalosiphum maidis TaxID=43146 RepID=UPI000F00B4E1|nr:obscurin-like isoform X5 [Rhopalosiphum maidis]